MSNNGLKKVNKQKEQGERQTLGIINYIENIIDKQLTCRNGASEPKIIHYMSYEQYHREVVLTFPND
jgi:hypothetical protein